MNRKQKIVVSIVGITIVLLALLGLTYAYYLTRIQGNTNTTSISITTADLKLEYSEGEDSNISLTGLMPGEDIPAKTFTVTNSGNSKVDNYVVAIIDVINTLSRTEDLTYTLTCVQKNAEGVVTGTCNGVNTNPATEYPIKNSMIVTNSIDAEYTHEYALKLTYENLTDTDQSIDMGSTIKGKVQIYGLSDTIDLTGTVTGASDGDYVQINSEQKISQIIKEVDGETTKYTYTLVGIEPGTHSLKIMDKNGVKKTEKYIVINSGNEASVGTTDIEVEDETVTVPLITMTSLSRSTTININKTTSEYTPTEEFTEYTPPLPESLQTLTALGLTANSGTPDFSQVATTDEGIFAAEDNDGTSYYFRGNVTNNYVKFANFYWRIVRINGDGTLRIIYDGTSKHSNSDSTIDRVLNLELEDMDFGSEEIPYINENLKNSLEAWYNTNIVGNNYSDKVADTTFCNNLEYTDVDYCGEEDEDGTCTTYYTKKVYNGGNENFPTLECPTGRSILTVNNGSLTHPIGIITADEVIMAGGTYNSANTNYYLYRSVPFRTMTPAEQDYDESQDFSIKKIHTGMLTTSYLDSYSCSFEEYDEEMGDYICIREYAVPVINLTKQYARTLNWNSEIGVYTF